MSILASSFFMLHIYSSIKYSVLLLLPSPIQEAAMSLPPCARTGRQTFDRHISALNESHSNHNFVVFQQEDFSRRLNTTPETGLRIGSFIWSTRAASYMGLLETPKPLRWWLLWLCRKINLKIGRSNVLSHPIPFSSFVQFISSWFFNWAGW